MIHICDSCHSNPSTQRCAGCSNAWYCSRACQRADWLLHKFDCNTPHGPSTADRLWVACTHNRAPADLQTRLDYGFQRAFTLENRAMLLGVYQDLKGRYNVSSRTVDRWRVRGGREGLVREIGNVYEGTREGERGVFYEWFVEHQYVLDGKTAEEWGEREAKRDLDAQIMRAGWVYSGGGPAAEMDCINDWIGKLPRGERDCQYFAGSLLTSVYQVPEVHDAIWTTFGFCACNMDKDGVGLGRIYRKLLERTTFDELVKAYTSSQMYALLASKGLTQELDEQYPLVKDVLRLSPNTNLSVWDLKRFVLQKKTPDPKSPNFLLALAPAAYSDYGFANCNSPDDTNHLRDVYMYMFQLACRPNMPSPLELHQACIENRLYEHTKGLIKLNEKAKHMYKRLMKNSYKPGLAVSPAGVAIYPGSTEMEIVDDDFALPQEKSVPADKTDKSEPALNAVVNSLPAVAIDKSASVITEVEVFSVPVVVDAVTPSVTAEEPLTAATEENAAPVVVAEQATVEDSSSSTVQEPVCKEPSTAAEEDVATPLPVEQAVVEESSPSAIEEPAADERSIPVADKIGALLPVADETKAEEPALTSTIEEPVIKEKPTPAVQEVAAPPPAVASTIAKESAPASTIEEPVAEEKLTPVVDEVTTPLSAVEEVTVEELAPASTTKEPAVEEKVTEAVEELVTPLPVVNVQESADESASPPASETPGVEERSAPTSAADEFAELVTVADETDTVVEDQVIEEEAVPATDEITRHPLVIEQVIVKEPSSSPTIETIVEEKLTPVEEEVVSLLSVVDKVVFERSSLVAEESVLEEQSTPVSVPVVVEAIVEPSSVVEEVVVEEQSTPAAKDIVSSISVVEVLVEASASPTPIEEPVTEEPLTPAANEVTSPVIVADEVITQEYSVVGELAVEEQSTSVADTTPVVDEVASIEAAVEQTSFPVTIEEVAVAEQISAEQVIPEISVAGKMLAIESAPVIEDPSTLIADDIPSTLPVVDETANKPSTLVVDEMTISVPVVEDIVVPVEDVDELTIKESSPSPIEIGASSTEAAVEDASLPPVVDKQPVPIVATDEPLSVLIAEDSAPASVVVEEPPQASVVDEIPAPLIAVQDVSIPSVVVKDSPSPVMDGSCAPVVEESAAPVVEGLSVPQVEADSPLIAESSSLLILTEDVPAAVPAVDIPLTSSAVAEVEDYSSMPSAVPSVVVEVPSTPLVMEDFSSTVSTVDELSLPPVIEDCSFVEDYSVMEDYASAVEEFSLCSVAKAEDFTAPSMSSVIEDSASILAGIDDPLTSSVVKELSQPVVIIEDFTAPPVMTAAPTPIFVAELSTPVIVKDAAPATLVNDISPPQVAANKASPTQAAAEESSPQAAENPAGKNNEVQQPTTPPFPTETVSHSRWNVFSGSASLLKRAFRF